MTNFSMKDIRSNSWISKILLAISAVALRVAAVMIYVLSKSLGKKTSDAHCMRNNVKGCHRISRLLSVTDFETVWTPKFIYNDKGMNCNNTANAMIHSAKLPFSSPGYSSLLARIANSLLLVTSYNSETFWLTYTTLETHCLVHSLARLQGTFPPGVSMSSEKDIWDLLPLL